MAALLLLLLLLVMVVLLLLLRALPIGGRARLSSETFRGQQFRQGMQDGTRIVMWQRKTKRLFAPSFGTTSRTVVVHCRWGLQFPSLCGGLFCFP